MTTKLLSKDALPIIMTALNEDLGSGDITNKVLFEKDEIVLADIVAKESCVLCGIDVARWVFNALDENIVTRPLYKDGSAVKKDKKILSIKGSAKNILTAERTALNFLSRLSGVATTTSEFVRKIKGKDTRLFSTRKTMPGMRALDKYAVRVGEGINHRTNLGDGVLIKDNHLFSLRNRFNAKKIDVIKKAIASFKEKGFKDIEVEVDNLKEFEAALYNNADIIMLDNMKLDDIKKAVKLRNKEYSKTGKKILIEVSGGVNLESLSKLAATGVDRISTGFITHSARSIDFSLEIC
ncbi:MAG: carboxylating nicotinate-nucleotide diphosphorylase [Candidatus Omnitrophota bacterium]